MSGRVVALNGASSAGKSTLAAALQARLVAGGEPWIVMATDDTFAKLHPSFFGEGEHAELGVAFVVADGDLDVRLGPVARRLLGAHMGMVRAAANAGINVVVDEVLVTAEQWQGWCDALDGVEVSWVRVDAPLDVLEARERARGDRAIGMAREQHGIVHRFPDYAVVVDTSVLAPDAAADAVVSALPGGPR